MKILFIDQGNVCDTPQAPDSPYRFFSFYSIDEGR